MYIKLYNVNSDTQDTFTLSHRKVNWVIQIRIITITLYLIDGADLEIDRHYR